MTARLAYTSPNNSKDAPDLNAIDSHRAPPPFMPPRRRPLRRQSPQHTAATTKREVSDSASSTTTPNPSSRVSQARASSLCLNVLNVIFGNRLITPWYPSLYREELVTGEPVDRLFVCDRCFRYSREIVLGLAHRRFCEFHDTIPGRVVYDHERYSIYELDGEDYQLFTQNLSLFAKLFIENKSVCFDVTTFIYYLLVDKYSTPPAATVPPKPSKPSPKSKVTKSRSQPAVPAEPPHPQVVGFFSKEKLSWDNNNLACILVFPPWQRLGLGQMLMGASYELARREGRLGGPERPLSTLGKKSYFSYWSRTLAQTLLAAPNKSRLSMEEISESTYMIPEDVVSTLLEMEGMLGTAYKGKDGEQRVRLDKGRVRLWLARNGIDVDAKPPIDLEGFLDDAQEDAAASEVGDDES